MSSLSTAVCPDDIPKTLIFTKTKKDACRVYGSSVRHARDKKYVSMFHASQAQSTKSARINQLTCGSLRCLICTIAFGMVRNLLVLCTVLVRRVILH